MGDKTGIEWTDHTFNPWWGCAAVSPACKHCYAETFAARFGVEWGIKAERKPASEKYWRKPVAWNAAAEKAGQRARVFCASMADVFEDRRDLDPYRERLFVLIEATPWLDWQLLTKRPEAVMRLVPERWHASFPANVWVGTTVEDQRRAEERIKHLLHIPAAVRFVSCEPLLGAVDLGRWVFDRDAALARMMTGPAAMSADQADDYIAEIEIGWVIAGGESGPGARPMHPDWARRLRDLCASAGIPFFFKQWGEWAPYTVEPGKDLGEMLRCGRVVQVRADGESDGHFRQGDVYMERVGKKAAGALLDGVEHKAFPGFKERP